MDVPTALESVWASGSRHRSRSRICCTRRTNPPSRSGAEQARRPVLPSAEHARGQNCPSTDRREEAWKASRGAARRGAAGNRDTWGDDANMASNRDRRGEAKEKTRRAARRADDGASVAASRDRDAERCWDSTGMDVPTERESPEQESKEQESTEQESTEQGSTELEATEADERVTRERRDTKGSRTGRRRTGAGRTGAGDDASKAPNRKTKCARPHIFTPEHVSSEESRGGEGRSGAGRGEGRGADGEGGVPSTRAPHQGLRICLTPIPRPQCASSARA